MLYIRFETEETGKRESIPKKGHTKFWWKKHLFWGKGRVSHEITANCMKFDLRFSGFIYWFI